MSTPWYAVGSVSVTAGSTAINGSGTGWSGTVRAGDVLWVAGVSCRIAAVNSGTSLTLARPWPGATASGAYYEVWLTPDEAVIQAQLRALLDRLANGNLEALAGLTTAANQLAYFNGAGSAALTTLTSAARSLLDDTTTDAMLATLGALPRAGGTVTAATTSIAEALLAVRDNRTTSDGTPNFAFAVNRQNSPSPALLLGSSGLNEAVISANNTDLRIGRLASGAFDETLRITNSGKLAGGDGVGAESTLGSGSDGQGWVLGSRQEVGTLRLSRWANAPLILNRSQTSGPLVYMRHNTTGVGSISVSETGTTYATTSDHRLKGDLEEIGATLDEAVIATLPPALARVARLRPVSYRWLQHPAVGRQTGFLAHELAEVVPHAVSGAMDAVEPVGTAVTADGTAVPGITEAEAPEDSTWTQTGTRPVYQSADYGRITPELTAAIQSLTALVLAQATRIAALEARLEQG